MQNRSAIIILSDPASDSEEALGRLFNGLASAYEFHLGGDDVRIYFQGAATRWPSRLVDDRHPAHELFSRVSGLVVGASCGCADAFGARDDLEDAGIELLTDNDVPGTSGLPSLRALLADGYSVLTF